MKIAVIDCESNEKQWLAASDYTRMFNAAHDSILKIKQEWVDKFSQKYKHYMECCYCGRKQLQMLKQVYRGDVREFKLWESMISDSLQAIVTAYVEGIRQLVLHRIHNISQNEGYTLVIDKDSVLYLNEDLNTVELMPPTDLPAVSNLSLQYESALQEKVRWLRNKVDHYPMEIKLCCIKPSDEN